jgi:hypothetical protein
MNNLNKFETRMISGGLCGSCCCVTAFGAQIKSSNTFQTTSEQDCLDICCVQQHNLGWSFAPQNSTLISTDSCPSNSKRAIAVWASS